MKTTNGKSIKLPVFRNCKVYKIYHKRQGRFYVRIMRNGAHVVSMSYARYLMTIHLNRRLKKNEHVDHRNDIKTDDRIDNLQILTQAENNKKIKRNKAIHVWLVCEHCKKRFKRLKRQFKPNNKHHYCCRSCQYGMAGSSSVRASAL